MSVRVFTIEEANRLVPMVEEKLRWFQTAVQRIVQTQDSISVLLVLGAETPDAPDHRELVDKRTLLEELVEQYSRELEEFNRLGCLIKDLEQGLVDFYGHKDGRLIFLCWRMGEQGIQYWHEIHSGFGGRRPVSEL
ncbi:MAG: DUF2203 domain-containing protein [Candidatus Eisenbacteria bacterium]